MYPALPDVSEILYPSSSWRDYRKTTADIYNVGRTGLWEILCPIRRPIAKNIKKLGNQYALKTNAVRTFETPAYICTVPPGILFETLIVAQLVKILTPFMEPQYPLLCLHEPDECNPRSFYTIYDPF